MHQKLRYSCPVLANKKGPILLHDMACLHVSGMTITTKQVLSPNWRNAPKTETSALSLETEKDPSSLWQRISTRLPKDYHYRKVLSPNRRNVSKIETSVTSIDQQKKSILLYHNAFPHVSWMTITAERYYHKIEEMHQKLWDIGAPHWSTEKPHYFLWKRLSSSLMNNYHCRKVISPIEEMNQKLRYLCAAFGQQKKPHSFQWQRLSSRLINEWI